MTYAAIYEDVVQVAGTDADTDAVADEFPTDGRTVEQIRAELSRRYGALAPTTVFDERDRPARSTATLKRTARGRVVRPKTGDPRADRREPTT